MPSPWQEISHFISPENMDWAVILLKESESRDRPLGFLFSRDDLENIKSVFVMNRMGLMKIKQKDLSLKHQFIDWTLFSNCSISNDRPRLRQTKKYFRPCLAVSRSEYIHLLRIGHPKLSERKSQRSGMFVILRLLEYSESGPLTVTMRNMRH